VKKKLKNILKNSHRIFESCKKKYFVFVIEALAKALDQKCNCEAGVVDVAEVVFLTVVMLRWQRGLTAEQKWQLFKRGFVKVKHVYEFKHSNVNVFTRVTKNVVCRERWYCR